MKQSPIALLTDFGQSDPFVGIMKGVILGINPSAVIADICHDMRLGDVKSASFALKMSFPYFPEGTIIVAVVDPGVGTARRAVAAQIGGRFVVCPDNGLISWIVKEHPLEKSVALDKSEFLLPEISSTFHGRDIFAPIAAHLSLGVGLDELGSKVENLVLNDVPTVAVSARSLVGEVVYIDRFGNMITNIKKQDYESWSGRPADGKVKIQLGSSQIDGICEAYGDVPKGHGVSVWGSAGTLELAINGGNIADTLSALVGSHIAVYNLEETK